MEMGQMSRVQRALDQAGWMGGPGAWFLVDGQYGSTGKGLVAGMLAELFGRRVDYVTSNAGPNSGHTSYYEGEKIVLQQLPTFGVVGTKAGCFEGMIFMNAGAIIDADKIEVEIALHDIRPFRVFIHPNAALVSPRALAMEQELRDRIGSTGKGTGAAQARKVMREPDAVAGANIHPPSLFDQALVSHSHMPYDKEDMVFVEVSQGFSLSINEPRFYPFTTSRDCTVMQAMSDARIHPKDYAGCMMVCRTFPIRVAGNSGGHYLDQREISWGELGVEPEITTVTQKTRRVFTWSRTQFQDAVKANRPEYLFINFMQYLGMSDDCVRQWLEENVMAPYEETMGRPPRCVLTGWGPTSRDVRVYA